ncbi:WD40-repeat-containing domain protein [Chaetomidium leptoderma]|uniref:WD40-repeat-containing domain protein n=1 Tax=Chaetomidium leptoderma TaxID=669021 RepID=A0AAN6ZVE6_9PEZI|nr:WD40-repeat-containing domain protein [Chaetomidium leptoderma]
MSGIWATIKSAAPALGHQHQHESSPRLVEGSATRPPSPPRILGTPPSSSQSLPRPPSSLDHRAGSRSQSSTTLQSHSRSAATKSPARLSRNSTSSVLKDKGRGKDREVGPEDAGEAGTTTTAITGTGNGTSSSIDVARPAAATPAHTPGSSSAIDPLSQHILMRKNTEPSIPQRLTQMAEGLARASSDLSRNVTPAGEVPKDKSKKGGSFLSRLGMRGGRKKELGDLDSDSEMGSEVRMDGINARVFSETLGSPLMGGGYVPHHKEPPRYIRTKASNKRTREFTRMFLAQELVGTRPPQNAEDLTSEVSKAPVVSVSVAGTNDRSTTTTGGAIWATEFSKDGKYLATAGRDHVVRIWAVLSTPEERRAYEEDEAVSGGAEERLSAPVFRAQPVKEFQGHTGEVLDLSWSKNNFLLSSSMDKTVRLWHMSRSECLCTFKHKDFVTRLAFHPRDDRFFLAGSLDTMLRLWSIPDQAVAFSAQLPDLVTAVAFSPDGKVAIAGLLNGLCMFYETEGLKLSSQLHVRSSRGKNAKGSKITGIQTMAMPPPNPVDMASSASASVVSADLTSPGEVQVLITSNDSRIRIYSLRDKSLDVKLKGPENQCSQIAATFSDDGKHVICGSEDRKTFIWSLAGGEALVQDRDKSPCEYFEAHGDIVTTALFAPTRTRMLLDQSGDPIYDLCNPPPVVLQSLEEAASAAASQVALTNESQNPAPVEPPPSKRPEPSAAYIARSTHYDGHIIVTTGDTGIIKVFRQDCAAAKRRNESWETGSTFSRKLAAHGSGYVGGGLGRSGSILTRTSAGSTAHSRRASLSQSIAPGMIGPPQLNVVGPHSDHILSWRQGISESGGDRRSALLANGGGTPARSVRSISPTKASRTSLNSAYNLASEARKQPYAGASPSAARNRASSTLTSPTASVFGSPSERISTRLVKDKERLNKEAQRAKEEEEEGEELSVPPTPGFTLRPTAEESGLSSQPDTAGGGSSSFWNLGRWRGIAGFRGGGSSNQGGPMGTRVGGSHGSQPSMSSKTRNQTEGSGNETEVAAGVPEDDGASSKQQSVGVVLPAKPGSDGKAARRKSICSVSLLREGGSDSDSPSVPINSGVENKGGYAEDQRGSGDGPPFQGHSHASRLSSL